MLTPQDFLDAGYHRFDEVKHLREKNATYGFQKLISDQVGKRYYITVYVYDNRQINLRFETDIPDFSFSPICQFSDGEENEMFADVELLLYKDNNVEDIEQKFDTIWKALGCFYYEKFH